MAACVKNFSRTNDQELMKTWIQQRFLTSRSSRNKLSLPAKRPAVNNKSTKPSFTFWNSPLELRNGTHYSSIAYFHHLAINFLIYDVACITNASIRNFANDKDGSTWDSYLGDMNEIFAKDNLEKELTRLRRKGAMKDILNKVPEGIQGIKGHGTKGDKDL